MGKFQVAEEKTIQQMENETIQFWKDNRVFEKSVEERSPDNLYVFYDGPPFISGLPHYGYLLGSIAKDVVPRYWTMKGKRVERVWGWDAHGLPVENKVQQKLGIKNRREIEKYGLEKFTKECYVYTSETSEEWKWYIDKIGRWVDMEHAYKTIDQNYMESVMWAFKRLYDKGLIYEGIYTSLYCPTCGTPVSNFEIAMDNTYKDYEDPTIVVKFPVITKGKFEGVNILAWTTTPWTIPSNRALVVKDDETYVVVEYEGEKYALAKPRLEPIFGGKKYNILVEIQGSDLLGLEYKAPYTFFKQQPGEFKVYKYEGMVTMDDGTGVVHSAPGFGEIDTEMGRHYGLTIMMTLDDEAKFLPGTAGKNPFEGVHYLKANPTITADLKEKGYLFEEGKIVHRVPYHDRCDTLCIQKAQSSWFIKVQDLKEKLLEENKGINWVPDRLKEGRFALGIKQAPDWCISRSRFWATPMPIWVSEDGEKIVVGSVKELEELSGQKVKDLHRPYIDEIKIHKNGKTFTRIPEVLDCWMESGSMPYAQIHYPFENQEKFEKSFPGDFIGEYIAQVRAWFYVTHVLSVALFDTNAFKNVISTGVMQGTDGRKMSKTYNNYPDPRDVLEKVGGDALRLYLMGSPLMMGENANFDNEELTNKLKNVINPLWNSAKFFLIYASEYGWDPAKAVKSTNTMDAWILARLHQTVKDISTAIEKYVIPDAVKPIEVFVDDLSRWYVRRSRARISAGDSEALSTLYEVLDTFCKASAPLIPFITERIYQQLHPGNEVLSVHLCEYPAVDEKVIKESQELQKNMQSDRDFVSQILALRTALKLAVRQPLQCIYTSREVFFKEVVQDEVNVKEIFDKCSDCSKLESDSNFKVTESKDAFLNVIISDDLKLEGYLREFTRKVQDLRKESMLTVSEKIKVYYPESPENDALVKKFSDVLKQKLNAVSLSSSDSFKVEKYS